MKIFNISLMLKGMAMGVAEVIPGVSGGTIAFITGIYEDLLNSIKAFGPEAFSGYKNGGFSGLWKAINGPFLLSLLSGMLIGILVAINAVTWLLEHYPEPLWGFFFGLIIASAWLIGKQIDNWDVKKGLALIIGIGIAYSITILSPSEGSTSLPYVFLSGLIAISALLLPGISGSFILLLMGMYTIIIPTLKNLSSDFSTQNVLIIGVFSMGCLIGLVGFSRVLSWLFKWYKDIALALLTGFLLGALNKIWPWRNVESVMMKDSGDVLKINDISVYNQLENDTFKLLSEANVLPDNYLMGDSYAVLTIFCIFAAVLAVVALDKLN